MDYFELSQTIGIDTLINKKLLTANTIFRYVRRGDVVDMTTLSNLNVEILEFQVHQDSKVTGLNIRDIDFPRTATSGGVIKAVKGKLYWETTKLKLETVSWFVVCPNPSNGLNYSVSR